jgi:hypothetical protein
MKRTSARRLFAVVAVVAAAGLAPTGASWAHEPADVVHVTTLPGASGTALGPRGDLFVASPSRGIIYRLDHRTHAVSIFNDALPKQVLPLGGVMDVAFQGSTAYALVTLVGPDVGGHEGVGLYRLDGPKSATLVADIGAWSIEHPPSTNYSVPSGVQYALQPFRGDFLVTDGHHNRVLRVGADGSVAEFLALDNVVPTGLERHGRTIFVAEAGPVPHEAATGRVISVDASSATVTGVVATGGPLLVDVERGRGGSLYALSQGTFPAGGDPGSPALPDTGSLLQATHAGSFRTVATGLDRPTSLELDGSTAWVVGLAGDVSTVQIARRR